MGYIIDHVKVGGQARDNYICNKSEDDLLIFGSSRAVHHYNASMLEDSLGYSSYNCGEDGNGIILSYGRLHMIKERHQPKIIIYDVNPSFDIVINDNRKYLGYLRAHYDRDGIAPIFYDIDKVSKYKMQCRMYRYNSTFLQNTIAFLTGIANDEGIKGFRPSKGEMDTMKISRIEEKNDLNIAIDSLKVEYINKFIDLCNDSKLVFVVSPIWYGMDIKETEYIKNLCVSQNICFIDFSNDPKYVHQNAYFIDGSHLNEFGANEFTKDLIDKLQKEYDLSYDRCIGSGE